MDIGYMDGFDLKVSPEEYCRMNCYICEDDFNTLRPNPYRIDRLASDIHEYLKYKVAYQLKLRKDDAV